MILKTETAVTFILPDEYEQSVHFQKTHDMTEWKESLSTVAVTFKCEKYYKVDYKKKIEGAENAESFK